MVCNKLRFVAKSPAAKNLGLGWAVPEPWGVWSTSQQATVFLKHENENSKISKLSILMSAYLNAKLPRRKVGISINGFPVGIFSYPRPWFYRILNRPIKIRVPEFATEKSILELRFHMAEQTSPSEVGDSDNRKLGVGLQNIAITETDRDEADRAARKDSEPVQKQEQAVREWKRFGNAKLVGDEPSILIIKVDHIGDFVTALKSFALLKEAWPKSKLTLVCSPFNVTFAKRLKIFEKIVPFSFFPTSDLLERNVKVDVDRKVKEFSRLNLGRFDIAVDLRHDEDTRPLLEVTNARYKAGYESSLLSKPLDLGLPNVESAGRETGKFTPIGADHRLRLLAHLIVMSLREEGGLYVKELIADNRTELNLPPRFVALSVSSGAEIRRWPTENVTSLCQRLFEEGYPIVFLGGKEEVEETSEICSQLPKGSFVNLAGKAFLSDVPMVLSRSALFIGYDTGITHLAAHLGVPTLGIYAAVSDPNVWAARGKKVSILRTDVSCSPCYLRKNLECEYDRSCLTAISPKQAFDSAMQLIGKAAARAKH